ncbi:OmpA family protein [Oceaniglobus roseus]|uniref:OmpA family protein n=1 Tax=Oceaniglobus roseus TaxID=1737570 RepID=UPI000C7F6A1A|nr:OmpA family protein [Kandeliimicrobium roseum]
MRLSSYLPAVFAFTIAAVVSIFSASFAVEQIERTSVQQVTTAMRDKGYDWVTVSANGLQVGLAGTAPDEASRFRALTVANNIVDSARVIDGLEVAAAEKIDAPHFSIEILKNGTGVSLIGLVPAATDRAALMDRILAIKGAGQVSDLLETADFPAPDGWEHAVAYGIRALERLGRAKVSIAADQVTVSAISDSRLHKKQLETDLTSVKPAGLELVLDIAAPRPVITPFTLRFLIDGDGARFDACSAATEQGRARIVAAALAAGVPEPVDCTIGLGVPSPDWPKAAEASIQALAALGAGSVTLSDVDVTLVADENATQADFDAAVGQLEGALPAAFSLTSVLPEKAEQQSAEGKGPPEFTATKGDKGMVKLSGRIRDDRARTVVTSFARARFGIEKVEDSLRSDEALPDGWSPRILAALKALVQLNSGSIVVKPDVVEVKGVSGNPDARADVTRILGDQLGAQGKFKLDIRYDKKLDPVLGLPTPEECVDQINQVLAARKITFAPGSAEIDADARETVDKIAELLRTCDDVQMEIGGYTDSQGREVMNQQLSQARAESVLTALAARRVATANLTAVGFGEERPIATNETEEGREANRRIEFKLIVPEGAETAASDAGTPEGGDGADAAAADAGTGDAPAAEGSGDEDTITGGAGTANEQN